MSDQPANKENDDLIDEDQTASTMPSETSDVPPWEDLPKAREIDGSDPVTKPVFVDPFLQKHSGEKRGHQEEANEIDLPNTIPPTVGVGATAVELPLSKNHQGENFYVASIFMPKDKAALVKEAYDFARVCDDIADSPVLATLDKRGRLEGFRRALLGQEEDPDYKRGLALRQTLLEHGLGLDYMEGLMDAFLMDVDKSRYQTWDELVTYCHLSTAMVGRMMLDVFKEHPSLYPLSDALCYALQILNHLSDMKADLLTLDRCYLPADLMRKHDVSMDDLRASSMPPNLRACLDEALDHVANYLNVGKALVQEVDDPRLAIEVSGLITVLTKWHGLLKNNDPLENNLTLSKGEKMWHFMKGAWRGLMA